MVIDVDPLPTTTTMLWPLPAGSEPSSMLVLQTMDPAALAAPPQ